MNKPKKIKGQIPYRHFLWIDEMAQNRRVRRAVILQGLVKAACSRQIQYSDAVRNWSCEVKKRAPNNVYFLADSSLEVEFEHLKIMNQSTSDSEMIRMIIVTAYNSETAKRSLKPCYAAKLF